MYKGAMAIVPDVVGGTEGDAEIEALVSVLTRAGILTQIVPVSKLPLGTASLEKDFELTAATLTELEEASGVAASVAGIGIGTLTAQRVAYAGLAHACVLWGALPILDRLLRATWDAARSAFAWREDWLPGTEESLTELRAVMGEMAGRTSTTPLHVTTDVHGLRHFDARAFDFAELGHRIEAVGIEEAEFRPNLTLSDAQRVTDWLLAHETRSVTAEPRIEGLLRPKALAAPDERGSIFISYTQRAPGLAKADHVERYLHAAGIRNFRDKNDLGVGDVAGHITRAFQRDCDGGLLIITKELAQSSFVPEQELPLLLARSVHRNMDLGIFNTMKTPEGKLDENAPDSVLNLPAGTLSSVTQFDLDDDQDMAVYLRSLLEQKLSRLKDQPLELDVQTYISPDLEENRHADLRLRAILGMRSPEHEATGLHHQPDLTALGLAWPLVSESIQAATPSKIRITGGAHTSLAIALGAALIQERVKCPVEIVDRYGLWGETVPALPGPSRWEPSTIPGSAPDAGRVAVFVNFKDRKNSLFADLRARLSDPIAASLVMTRLGPSTVEPSEGMALIQPLVDAIRDFADEHNAQEILLCGSLSFPLAILLGRYLNTFGLRLYEPVVLLDAEGGSRMPKDRWYHRLIDIGYNDGQITSVYPDISFTKPPSLP